MAHNDGAYVFLDNNDPFGDLGDDGSSSTTGTGGQASGHQAHHIGQEVDPPPGHNLKVMFGQHKNMSYLDLVTTHPDYCIWALAQPTPSPKMANLCLWINAFYLEQGGVLC